MKWSGLMFGVLFVTSSWGVVASSQTPPPKPATATVAGPMTRAERAKVERQKLIDKKRQAARGKAVRRAVEAQTQAQIQAVWQAQRQALLQQSQAQGGSQTISASGFAEAVQAAGGSRTMSASQFAGVVENPNGLHPCGVSGCKVLVPGGGKCPYHRGQVGP